MKYKYKVEVVKGSAVFSRQPVYSMLFKCRECGWPKRIDCECDDCPQRLKCLGSPTPKCNPEFGSCAGCFLRASRVVETHLSWVGDHMETSPFIRDHMWGKTR